MRKSLVTAFLLAFLTTIAACTPGESSPISSSEGFVGGNDGLKLTFLDNSPPDEVFETDSNDKTFNFQVIVMAENMGENKISGGDLKVDLKGISASDFGVTGNLDTKLTQRNTEELTPVSKNTQGDVRRGSLEQLTFPDNGNEDFAYTTIKVDQSFDFVAEACYKYKTTAISQVCLKKDLRSTDNEICDLTGSKPVTNSGAPMHVTSVVQDIAGTDSIIVDFEVRKVGSVDVFYTSTTSERPKCVKTDPLVNDRVKVTVSTGIGEDATSLECSGLTNRGDDKASGELILDNGAGRFTCVQNLAGVSFVDGVKTFEVELQYDVEHSIKKSVLVKNID